jgi:hypothetical protein
MNALAFPTMKTGFPCAPGSTWSWQGTTIIRKVFTVSGPYTPSPGLVALDVWTIGGGGAGGAILDTTGGQFIWCAAAGGSGGWSILALPAPMVVGGVNVIIGAGGVPGPVDGITSGGDGQATSFGALCVANGGGGGGSVGAVGGNGIPGKAATPGVGDWAMPGNAGAGAFYQILTAPLTIDIASPRGGAIFGGTTESSAGYGGYVYGAAGMPNTGAGGNGAVINQNPAGAAATGGAGGSGICVVTEYCVATSNMDGCGCGCARVPAWGCT